MDDLRDTWWRDREGGTAVRVEWVSTHGRAAPVVVLTAAGEAGRECERVVIDAGVFERRFVPIGGALA